MKKTRDKGGITENTAKNDRQKVKVDNASRFRFSATSGHLLPLQTIRRRLTGIWQSITWPICVKILKANAAVTIALGLVLIDPIRTLTQQSGILACVAVEFVHPVKSYGFLFEDVLVGTIMCCVSAAWSIFGIFLASLQANVGGMLSATIMVLSLTSAVVQKSFNAIPTVIIETFDQITQRQVAAFLRDNDRQFLLDQNIETLATIHQTVESLITTLVQRKRMVRREPSFNTIAPTDIKEITSIMKKLKVPIFGIGLSRAMEENMRKAGLEADAEMTSREAVADKSKMNDASNMYESIINNLSNLERPRSYYGCTDDEEEIEEELTSPFESFEKERSSTSIDKSTAKPRHRKLRWEDSMKVLTYWRDDYDDILNEVKPIYVELTDACSVALRESVKRLRRMQQLETRFQNRPFFYKWFYRWKVGPAHYEEEKSAYQYDPKLDPSIPLLKAIAKFHEHRLTGLNRLYTKSGAPRRVLLLLLTFQFNLHAYAEHIYTLSSLIYEMDKLRDKQRFWMPRIPFRKWFLRGHDIEEIYDLDTPGAVVDVTNPLSLNRTVTQRATLIAAASQQPQQLKDIESQRVLYRLETPHRGSPIVGEHKDQPYFHTVQKELHASTWRLNTLDPLDYHDPDVAYPQTTMQRFFYRIYFFLIKNVYTADVGFAIRACILVVFLSLPAFFEDSVIWYTESRGQWAAVVALIWMGTSVGSSFFGTMTRLVGTLVGAVQAIIIWEASRGSVPGLIILTFIFNLPWWLIYINGKFWKATGLFSLITISLIIGYAYSYRPEGRPVSVFTVAWERAASCVVGVIAALIISVFPFPRTGRVVLRHRISRTLSELGALYSSFLALLLKSDEASQAAVEANKKMFRSVAVSIRKQIKGERVLLEQSRFEPALRGIFPEDKYLHILQILDNILSLLLEMEYSLEKISHKWRMMIVKSTWKERKRMIASYLTALHLGSNALTSKAPLPPYVMRPTKTRRELTNKARRLKVFSYQHLGDREYTYYSAYLMNSEQLAVELELLTATIRDLVGPDSVSIWLNYKH
ncbi:hypothetical protein BDF20DRAFT_829762 [Mycotypha africana]|uniref:uncharacterized protein n=1 Tax=Mycotypha africana TaxID=64632 RepID=UPI0023005D7B|nr:uncharacterized protein BDF20DRAFT_829762 [Mycotypha africana]KAI8967353.1 hypothetical protein BDF20DRAFT_829762 [Mycotypha africana]